MTYAGRDMQFPTDQELEWKAERYAELHPEELAQPKRHPIRKLWDALRGRRHDAGEDPGLA